MVFGGGQIFLSYCREDAAAMRRVKGVLARAGLAVWTDQHLEPGTPSWQLAIEQAIDRACGLVVILSPDAKISDWVRNEVGYALARQVDIFPVLVRGAEGSSVPARLINYQYVDIRGSHAEAGLASLANRLTALCGGVRETSPPSSRARVAPTRPPSAARVPTPQRSRPWLVLGLIAPVLVGLYLLNGVRDDGSRGADSDDPTQSTTSVNDDTTTTLDPLAVEISHREPPDPAPPPASSPAGEVEVRTLIEGTGPRAEVGDTVIVHYVGKLTDGTVFDESWSRDRPFTLTLGEPDAVIAGWEEGLPGVRQGERRRLVIGSDKAYGSGGQDPIPPNAPLAFEIDVLDVLQGGNS